MAHALTKWKRAWSSWLLISCFAWASSTWGAEKPQPKRNAIPAPIAEKELIERLTRLEEGQKRLEEGQKSILREMDKRFEAVDERFEAVDKRFEALDRRLDQLGDIFIGIVAAFAAIVAVTISLAIWDRRTALRPYVERHRELMEREEKVERVLKGYAKIHPDLAELLAKEGLL